MQVYEFDGDTVLCRVCGDKASGFHYGVHACEGCKGFFRRSIQQKIQYRPCLKNQQCNIMRVNRNRCQYCRLKKCIAVGMSRDAVRFGRVPKKEKAKIMEQMHKVNSQSQVNLLNTILESETDVTHKVVEAHLRTCEFTQAKLRAFLEKAWQAPQFVSCPAHMACPLNPSPETSDGTKKWDEFSECFTPAIRNVVNFAKCIPGFQVLSQEDQVTLLKAGTFEVLLVHLACLFDAQTNTMCFATGKLYKRVSLTVTNSAGFLLDSMFDFAERLNAMQLSDHEVALFSAIVIIAADRPGLRNVEQVERVQNRITQALQSLMAAKHPEDPALFAKLLMKIPDLRTLNTLHSEKLLGLTVPAGSGKNGGSGVEKSRPTLDAAQAPYFPGGAIAPPAFSMFAGPMMANHLRNPTLQYPARPPDVSGIIPHQVALESSHQNQNIVLQTPLGTFHRYNSALQQQMTLNRHVEFGQQQQQHANKPECPRPENFQRHLDHKAEDSKPCSNSVPKFKLEERSSPPCEGARLHPGCGLYPGDSDIHHNHHHHPADTSRGSPPSAGVISTSSSPGSDVYPVRGSLPAWPQAAPPSKPADDPSRSGEREKSRKRQSGEEDEMLMKMQRFWSSGSAGDGHVTGAGYLPGLSMTSAVGAGVLHNPALAYQTEAAMHLQQQQQKHQHHQQPQQHQVATPQQRQQQHHHQQQQHSQQQQQQHRQQQPRCPDDSQHFPQGHHYHHHLRSPEVRQERSRSHEGSPAYREAASGGLNLPTLKTALSRPPLSSPPGFPPGWPQERKKSMDALEKADGEVEGAKPPDGADHLSDAGSSHCGSPLDPYFLHKKLKMKRRSSNETMSSESSQPDQDPPPHAISTMLYPMIPGSANVPTDFVTHVARAEVLKRSPRDPDGMTSSLTSYAAERLNSVVRSPGGATGHYVTSCDPIFSSPTAVDNPNPEPPSHPAHAVNPDPALADPVLRAPRDPTEGRVQTGPPLLSKTPPFGGDVEVSECPNSPPMLTPETDLQKEAAHLTLDKQRSPTSAHAHSRRDLKKCDVITERVAKDAGGKPRYHNSLPVENNNNNNKYFNGEGLLGKPPSVRPAGDEDDKTSGQGGALASQLSNGLCGSLPYSSGGVPPHPAYLPLPFTTMHPALIYQYNQMAAAHQMAQLQHLHMAQAQMALHHQVALGKPESHQQGAPPRKDQDLSRDTNHERQQMPSEQSREGRPLNLSKPPEVAPRHVAVKPEPL